MAKTSSYDKVALLICNHSLFSDFVEKIRERICTYKIRHDSFELSFDAKTVYPTFRAGFEGQNTADYDFVNVNTISEFWLPIQWIVSSDEIREVGEKIFHQKMVSTYNCRWVKGGEDGKDGSKCLHFKLPDVAYRFLHEKLHKETFSAAERIKETVQKRLQDPNIEDEKKEFLNKIAIQNIRNTLMKFRHLDTEILKTAFNEFICDDIISV